MPTATTLHIVNQSPYSSNALQRCLNALSSLDGVLLIEDAVYGSQILANALTGKDVRGYILMADQQARNHMAEGLTTIDYDRFVTLCCEYNKTLSWF